MERLRKAFLVLAAGAVGLTLAAGADGGTTTTAAQIRHAQGRIEALALDGSRIAYDVGSTTGKADNKVLVWNVRSGRTTRVSGKHTARADSTSTGAGVFALAIAGPRVAWLVNLGGNTEGDDYLFASSNPKERQVASDIRYGDNCPGRSQALCPGHWLGGLVGSGNLIALNRWTTDNNGALADGGLYVLGGAELKQVATGTNTVEASSADGGRVAVLRSDGSVGLYSSRGRSLWSVTPSPRAREVALSGHNLAVLQFGGTLARYDLRARSRVKAFSLHGAPTRIQNLDVQGNIAIYTAGQSVRAVNLSSGKDRLIGKLSRGDVALARIDSAGLAYAGNNTLVFVPFRRVAAAVAG